MSGHSKNPKGPQEKKPLTHGWIVVPSKTYPDRVYFYNTVTRCSTWKNPCEDTDATASGISRSNSPSPKRRSSKSKSRSPDKSKKPSKSQLYSLGKNNNIKVDSEIEDYDEQNDQYFQETPLKAFNLSHSDFFGPSSPDSVSSLKTDTSSSETPKSSSFLENNEKELWLRFVSSPPKNPVRKSVALSDFNEASSSLKNLGMEQTVENKKKLPESFNEDVSPNKNDRSDISLKRRNSKKRKGSGSKSEAQKKSIEEKIIKNVSFKKRDRTPAQTRLVKLRKQNAEKLKELTVKHPEFFAGNSVKGKNQDTRNNSKESGNFSDEEMDWEPSSEENDVRNINVFRQQLDKANDSSSDIFFGLQSDHSLSLPSKNHWFVALDTNIFVSCLAFVKEFRDLTVPDLGSPVIYVPWRVLQELDHLKDTKIYSMDKQLHLNVRKAITFLNENFKSGHPRLFGQSFEDFAKMNEVGVKAPDDEILQTCITFQKEHPSKKLMLLTNDKNLESKAIVSGVEAYSKERFQKKFLHNATYAPAVTTTSSSSKLNFNNRPKTREFDVDKCLCEVKSILKDFLPLVVETEMKIAFEGDWVKLAFKKPPWNIQDALECMLKHWRAVFFVVFTKETQSEAQKLFERLFKKEVETTEEVVEIIRIMQRLILCIKRNQKKKRPYLEPADVAMTKLSSLLCSLLPNHSNEVEHNASSSLPCVPIGDDSRLAEDASFCPVQTTSQNEGDVTKIKNVFRDIWDSLRSFCCSITDIVHSSGANGTSNLQELSSKMVQVTSEVSELVFITEKILELNLTEIHDHHPMIIHFSSFLVRVYPVMDPGLQQVLPRCLAAFFCDFEGRSLLSNSLKDFKEFCNDLRNAIEYFNTHLTG